MRHSPYLDRVVAESINAKLGLHQDYPKPGILFRDVCPLLADSSAFTATINAMIGPYAGPREIPGPSKSPDVIVGIESRGFIFGAAMAALLGVSFVPIRKKGAKYPGTLHEESYALEYGEATLVLQEGAIRAGAKAVVVDDLIATGGSAGAGGRLVQRQGGQVIGYSFVIELAVLKGAEKLGAPAHSVLSFD